MEDLTHQLVEKETANTELKDEINRLNAQLALKDEQITTLTRTLQTVTGKRTREDGPSHGTEVTPDWQSPGDTGPRDPPSTSPLRRLSSRHYVQRAVTPAPSPPEVKHEDGQTETQVQAQIGVPPCPTSGFGGFLAGHSDSESDLPVGVGDCLICLREANRGSDATQSGSQ